MNTLKKTIKEEIYEKLVFGNITSLDIILKTSRNVLCELTKLSQNEIDTVIKEAAAIIIAEKFKTVFQMPNWKRFTSGCASIDEITNGGLPINGITEVYGQSGVGKTQFCLQLGLTVQFPVSLGGLSKGAVYICTEDRYPAKRLKQMVHNVHLKNGDKVLDGINFEDNIFVEHIADYEQLRRCISVRLPIFLEHKHIGLLVIDSIAGIFRSENKNVNYTERSHELNFIGRQLKELGEKYHFAIICTNQVAEDPSTLQLMPCLGLTWSNIITCRFFIQKFPHYRNFEVIFAPDLPNKSCKFCIDKTGLIDKSIHLDET